MVQMAIPYTYGRTICVYMYGMYHMRTYGLRFKIRYWAVSSAGFAQGVKAPNGTIGYSKLN